MNAEQGKGQIRTWLTAFAGIILGWFASRAYLTDMQISAILNSPVFLAAAGMAANAIWSWFDKTNDALVKKVDALAQDKENPVKGVVVDTSSKEGRAIVAAVNSPTTAAAGSPAASNIAKA